MNLHLKRLTLCLAAVSTIISSTNLADAELLITNTTLRPEGLVLSGTGGSNTASYFVLATTDLTTPVTNWSAVATNPFDLNGNFNSTNPLIPGMPQQFFRLLDIGVLLPPLIGPSIITQPTNQMVIEGQDAPFSVVADGTAPLYYQWYFNTNTPLTDANTNSLIVTNAQTTDAGTYSVIITNVAGSVTSVLATLTVNPPTFGPSITNPPSSLTVTQGNDATFTVGADGTAPLAYQWLFNTNTLLVDATNLSLTITNVQASDAGDYTVRITNSVGSVISVVATLTVLSPPSIVTQPVSQTVSVTNNNVTFSVVAAGTAPLGYQWYFKTNTLLADATNSSLTITNLQMTNTGTYSVVVTNNYGSITSTNATLTVTPDFSMIGFATLSGFSSNSTLLAGGTTGGDGGPIVLATNHISLRNYAQTSNMVLRILIISNIDLAPLNNNNDPAPELQTGRLTINSNKTIFSTNGITISHGSFQINTGKKNVIIRNLKFRDMYFDPGAADPGFDNHDWDYIRVDGGHHVWVDHCDFQQVYDGMVDMKNGADYVTVSWCVFSTQKKCSLLSSSDSDTGDRGHLNVTFHHNWYYDVDERTPRLRFGNAHVFNMYYSDAHFSGKCIQSTTEAATLVENVYFNNAVKPGGGCFPSVYVNGGGTGHALKVVSSIITNSPGNNGFQQINQATFMFNGPFTTNQPPYAYTNLLDPLGSVPIIVTNWAGVGKLTSF